MLIKSDPIDSSASYIDYYINSNHNHLQQIAQKELFSVPQGNT